MSRRSLGIATLGVLVGSLCSSALALAWTGPTGSPPSNNVSAPINVGTTAQVKNGGLSLNSLAVFGNVLLSGLGSGVGNYLNFDYTTTGTSGSGSAGYGMRDNAGTLEFKNLGGAWKSSTALLSSFFAAGSNSTVEQIKFTDGTVQTSAAKAGGVSAVTTSSCVTGRGGSCAATCPAGYFRTGCSVSAGLGYAGTAYPSGANACGCQDINTGPGYQGTTCYAYCAI